MNSKFENGLSIIQLEDRYEMVAADGTRTRDTTIRPTLVIEK
jgi:hypothetical protein